MAIVILSDTLVNKIAAGEVVERPAAIVRELVDNAVDAGATDIGVYVEQGGLSGIRVQDDGGGMDRADALLAFERHATSKIREVEDLDRISTMGFRGEALSSIAAVAKVILRTRRAADPVGTELELAGGKIIGVRDCSAAPGSELIVRSLFYNMPARRKFLKSAAAELQRIKQWVLPAAISHPQLRYRLSADNRELLNLAPRASALDRARGIFRGAAGVVDYRQGPVRISGLIGHPALAQAGLDALIIFVNQRLVQDRLILKAVREGYLATLKDREYPVGYIQIECPPQLVDVNVHPQKTEVRFSQAREIFTLVRSGVAQAVAQFRQALPAAVLPGGERTPFFYESPGSGSELRQDSPAYQPGLMPTVAPPVSPRDAAPALLSAAPLCFSELRYVGQVLGCYLLCEQGENFYVVDMHAAHERCNYNRLLKLRRQRGAGSQDFLLPLEVELGETGGDNCWRQRELLSAYGIRIERSDGLIRVLSGPAFLKAAALVQVLKELAAVQPEEDDPAGIVEERWQQVAARLACHSSVRSGFCPSAAEVQALFKDLDDAEFSAACPHGRPVVVVFDRLAVEHWFGRDR